MPRPRFHKLAAEKQAAILDTAATELAGHGWAAASLHRLIDAAQISKGAFYYYFDDKDDLLGTVVERALGALVEAAGALGPYDDANGFWLEVEAMVTRVTTALSAEPGLGEVARTVASGLGANALPPSVHALIEEAKGFFAQVVEAGQGVDAVRTDVPTPLLVAMLTGLGEAADVWLAENWMSLEPAALAEVLATVMDALRRVAAP